ncbi:MAG: undecaprenyldiphospho-muramoylpentapeptide beta-N-acetylglucosaminyltransferase [Candidatus Omnitrophota bacterium]
MSEINASMKKIIIVAGGSGGHIFPALALAGVLDRDKGFEVVFVASRRALDRKFLADKKYKKYYLSINPMPYRAGLKMFVFALKAVSDAFRACSILWRERPRIVVGFGEYTSGAIVFLAKICGIKTLIHEQNVVPGRTNRFLARYADRIALSFEETKRYFNGRNNVLTGNPLRESVVRERRREGYEKLGIDAGRFTVLVMGGSQGASSLNNLACAALCGFDAALKNSVQVIHIAGVADRQRIQDMYHENAVSARVYSFIDDIYDAYAVSDMAVSRAGASSVFELAVYGRPMILVPYPADRHNQRYNAQFFAKHGAAFCIEEKNTDADSLRVVMTGLIADKTRLGEMAARALSLAKDNAAESLAQEIKVLV